MENAKILIYDGSFNGFLSAIYKVFEEKLTISDIRKSSKKQGGLFSEGDTVSTEIEKAKRVWDGISNKNHGAIRDIYFAYLSEADGVEVLLYLHIKKLFSSHVENYFEGMDDNWLKIKQLGQSVEKEKRITERSLHFESIENDVYLATFKPEFDVLPLISKHFRSKFKNREWIIYDEKRNYALHYDLESVELISPNTKSFEMYHRLFGASRANTNQEIENNPNPTYSLNLKGKRNRIFDKSNLRTSVI